jgi:hypothetical protein
MTPARIRDWRVQAERLRAVASTMKDEVARRGLLNAAATYDAMADEAETGVKEIGVPEGL